jgi:hypothetical protein
LCGDCFLVRFQALLALLDKGARLLVFKGARWNE